MKPALTEPFGAECVRSNEYKFLNFEYKSTMQEMEEKGKKGIKSVRVVA